MPEYIDRESVIAIIEEKQKALCPLGRFSRHYLYGTDRETFDNWQEIADLVDGIPVEDVEPVRHGRWIFKENLAKWGFPYLCTACNRAHNYQEKFCPNCGAKMDMMEEALNEQDR